MARIVHRLVSHARAHRAIADHRNRIPMASLALPAQIPGNRKAQRCADRRAGMGGAKRIIGAFAALGETADPIFLAQAAHLSAPTG